jgi:hypothetical protein
MNQEPLFPIDPNREFDASDESERLDEIERCVKQARPRPARLDAAAVARAAGETTGGREIARPKRRYRQEAALAFTWACGVAVGAMVMFVVMDHGARGTGGADGPALADESVTDSQTTFAERSPKVGSTLASERSLATERNSAVLARMAEPFSHESWDAEEPPLCAGMHLVHARMPIRFKTRNRPTESAPAGQDRSWEPSPRPGPPMTRVRLMESLLDETHGHVL